MYSAKRNGVSAAADTAGLAVSVFAPEARLAQVAAAGVGFVAAAPTGDKIGLSNGFVGYHLMMADWASFKGLAGTLVKTGAAITGLIGIINDGYNSYVDYQECREGKAGET